MPDKPEFQNASFIPFEHYVNQAKRQQRAQRQQTRYGSRRVDFTDAVDVSVIPIEDVPEFADTDPDFPPTLPMPLPEVTYIEVHIAVAEDVISADDVISERLERARNLVAARAFAECLRNGFFPPRCQECKR